MTLNVYEIVLVTKRLLAVNEYRYTVFEWWTITWYLNLLPRSVKNIFVKQVTPCDSTLHVKTNVILCCHDEMSYK